MSYAAAPPTRIRPVGDEFYGTVTADGQTVNVCAIATHDKSLVFLSAQGTKTALAALVGNLLGNQKNRKGVYYAPPLDRAWDGERVLNKGPMRYTVDGAPLPGLVGAWHGLIWPHIADLSRLETMPNLPLLTEQMQADGSITQVPVTKEGAFTRRYVFAPVDQPEPAMLTWMGVLESVGLPFHPAQAPLLWRAGLNAELVQATAAFGIQCWAVDGSPDTWAALYGQHASELYRAITVPMQTWEAAR